MGGPLLHPGLAAHHHRWAAMFSGHSGLTCRTEELSLALPGPLIGPVDYFAPVAAHSRVLHSWAHMLETSWENLRKISYPT